jgi:3-oxoacyl-[acyl-carrier protein] reductase
VTLSATTCAGGEPSGHHRGVRWEGATVVVTGASRGIGRAIAVAAAAKGARVGLVARSADDLAKVRAEVEQRGGAATIAVADLAARDQLDHAVVTLREELGPVDILVNNAGVGCYGPFVELAEDAVERVIELNLIAVLNLTRLVLPDMIRRRRGHIVNIGSIAGRFGAPFESVYSATKFGLAGFTEALAVEVAPFRVGVSMVNPGVVDTTFDATSGWPEGTPGRLRVIPPERVAEAVIAAVEHSHLERVVPRWLRLAHAARVVVPLAYKIGVRRTFARQLAEFERRWTPHN